MSPEFTSCQDEGLVTGHTLPGSDSVECKPSERSHLSTQQCLPSDVIQQTSVQNCDNNK